ncbi:serine hydrolase, partial [Paenibacillus thermoaerophilus]
MLRKELVKQEIEGNLERKVASDPTLHNVQLLIHSDKLDIHWLMAAGKTDEGLAHPHQPFHTASVGKTFTSVIVAKLVESGLAKFEDPVADHDSVPSSGVKSIST